MLLLPLVNLRLIQWEKVSCEARRMREFSSGCGEVVTEVMRNRMEMMETPGFIPGRFTHEITEGFNPQLLLSLWDGLKPIVITKSESPHVKEVVTKGIF